MTEAKRMAEVLRMIAQRYPDGRMVAVDSRTLGRIVRLLDPDGEARTVAPGIGAPGGGVALRSGA